ncbi:purple acid phosphatase superfamily protein [Tripterygium wilfordii]|uniref:Purple acid phosphatase superfamily protein n=2 Tax=Tripterygium wilfordii TaxID=458696 RepID=A0A7J7E1E2_TRIWF|nr:purple acid phosphatase superfamily protein [Tripterygium wilfordii]
MALSFLYLLVSSALSVHAGIPTTLDGPFTPVTAPLDQNFTRNVTDLPNTDSLFHGVNNGFEPEQVSVSLSAHHDSVWISWITGDFQIGEDIRPLDPESIQSFVRYGSYGERMTHNTTGHSLVYNQLYPIEGLQNYTSGIIHHVRLRGLKPNTLYQYQCGDPSLPLMSDIHYFRTMPVSSPRNYPSRIAVVGGLGLTYNTTSTFSHLMSTHPDLILLVGGVSYADLYFTNGTASHCYSCSFVQPSIRETYQPRWDYWGRFMEPLVANVPTMVVGGDHEIEQQAENQTFIAYGSRFAFPSEESGSSSTLYYSFNAGGVHFVILSAYVPYDFQSSQYKWLEKDLLTVDGQVTPWLVAVWHTPWYSTYKEHYRNAECMRVEMEDLLYAYGVDIVFSGQVNAYERSNRVYNYTLDECGPVHIIIGGGGNLEGVAVEYADEPNNCPEPSTNFGGSCSFNFTSGPATGKFCWDRQPEYSAYRESSFGLGILEVKNSTHALWSWHRNKDYYNIESDIIYMVRQPGICPPDSR